MYRSSAHQCLTELSKPVHAAARTSSSAISCCWPAGRQICHILAATCSSSMYRAVCLASQTGSSCADEFDKCVVDEDCCGSLECVNNGSIDLCVSPQAAGCESLGGACSTTADCCDVGLTCIDQSKWSKKSGQLRGGRRSFNQSVHLQLVRISNVLKHLLLRLATTDFLMCWTACHTHIIDTTERCDLLPAEG